MARTFHSLERTSPKGTKFIGRCVLCGATGLEMFDFIEGECPNPENKSEAEILLDTIKRVESTPDAPAQTPES